MILNSINKTDFIDVNTVQSIVATIRSTRAYATFTFKNKESITVEYYNVNDLREDIKKVEELKHE